MEPAPALPPAGWYDDPSDPVISRWWDGAQWTEHMQEKAPSPPPATLRPVPAPTPLAAPSSGVRTPMSGTSTGGGGSTNSPDASQPGTSGKAIAAAICPIALGPFGAIPAVVLATMALREIASNPGRGGKTLAVIGLVLGGIQILVVCAIVLPLMFGGSSTPGGVSSAQENSIHGTGSTSNIRVAHARKAIRNVELFEAHGTRCAAQGNCTVDAIAGDIQVGGGNGSASGAEALSLMGVTAEVTDGGAGFKVSAIAEGEGITFTSTGPTGHSCAPIDIELCADGTW